MKHPALVFLLVFLSATAIGQRVNFSGTWKLNEEKSELGPRFSLAPDTLRVDHTRKTLDLIRVSEFNGEVYRISQHLTLDGKACENIGFMDSVTRSEATWDRKSKILTIVTRGSMQDASYTLTQTISLKEGSLVVTSQAASEMGLMNETFVFDKFLKNDMN